MVTAEKLEVVCKNFLQLNTDTVVHFIVCFYFVSSTTNQKSRNPAINVLIITARQALIAKIFWFETREGSKPDDSLLAVRDTKMHRVLALENTKFTEFAL